MISRVYFNESISPRETAGSYNGDCLFGSDVKQKNSVFFFINEATKYKCQIYRVMLKVEMIHPEILEIKPDWSLKSIKDHWIFISPIKYVDAKFFVDFHRLLLRYAE